MHIFADFIKGEKDVGHTQAAIDEATDTQFTIENAELDALIQLQCDDGDESVDNFDVSTHFVESHEPVEEADHHIVTNYKAAALCSNGPYSPFAYHSGHRGYGASPLSDLLFSLRLADLHDGILGWRIK